MIMYEHVRKGPGTQGSVSVGSHCIFVVIINVIIIVIIFVITELQGLARELTPCPTPSLLPVPGLGVHRLAHTHSHTRSPGPLHKAPLSGRPGREY